MNLTADELARMRNVSTATVINWAKGGYPLDDGSKVPLPGVDKSGRKWVFDSTKVNRFFEKLRQKRWQMFTDPNIKTQRPVKRRFPKSGGIGSRLQADHIEEALRKRLNLTH